MFVRIPSIPILQIFIECMLNCRVNFLGTTVQTFKSCTSRPGVCHCLNVLIPAHNMPTLYAKHMNDQRSLQIKALFGCEVIPAFMPWKLGSNQTYGHVLCPGCPGIKYRHCSITGPDDTHQRNLQARMGEAWVWPGSD